VGFDQVKEISWRLLVASQESALVCLQISKLKVLLAQCSFQAVILNVSQVDHRPPVVHLEFLVVHKDFHD